MAFENALLRYPDLGIGGNFMTSYFVLYLYFVLVSNDRWRFYGKFVGWMGNQVFLRFFYGSRNSFRKFLIRFSNFLSIMLFWNIFHIWEQNFLESYHRDYSYTFDEILCEFCIFPEQRYITDIPKSELYVTVSKPKTIRAKRIILTLKLVNNFEPNFNWKS